ncbi:UDP-N-acetylmuramoyl-tripeptide--D-alanyl-D-alanine ligase [Amaricoccus sp.]|uniref:UDP-N-acetylmuramoyl-tripeptide--D-alanyl-D- alanine ligase n=1 Tax=Amaricoccus sp. TaxID=1872485 RepID=UPI001B53DF90|nr:UDP-N-acetylmuramoyl-tripeptide--D-alanyl-D-alanine ligase [Amaricoccus sp.]MBP7240847.1 UDP-N-acetylmuramoyl-tripeptide--D-alanyl-D-alanine ligase [Amaricoccus sp.]
MNALWTAADAAAATGGAARGDWAATGVAIDSRGIGRGDLFVALKAARDGHDFVADALSRGAAAALVSRVPEGVAADAPLLVVPDVQAALEALGRAGRARFRGRLVAVTGSAGKTGTKEMLRTALGAQGRVHAAEKSFNNHWGVPLTLARMDPGADFAAIEIGMNAPGEIGPLAAMARPHVAIVTTVAPVHLAAFRDLRGIAREKAAIYAGLEPGGAAVTLRDLPTYPILLAAAKRAGARPVRFGATGRPEFRLLETHVRPEGTCAAAIARGRRFLFKLAAPGSHLAMNALGVLACVDALGADMARAALALATWQAPEGRGVRWRVLLGPGGLDGTVTLIDESYNANPAAMAAAFEVLAASPVEDGVGRVGAGRRVAFLGDMLELGETELALHADLANAPGLEAVAVVHCAGPRMKALHDALPRAKRGEWFADAAAMAARAGRLLDAGDVALVKGSNGSRVGLVVEAIKRMGEARAPDVARELLEA